MSTLLKYENLKESIIFITIFVFVVTEKYNLNVTKVALSFEKMKLILNNRFIKKL